MPTAIATDTKRELKKMQAKLKAYAPRFDSEKSKMELSLKLSKPVGVRTLQTYFAGKGSGFAFTKELIETIEAVIVSQR